MRSERRHAGSLAIGLVGTYPPTKCGIATFTESLAKAMAELRLGCRVSVVASRSTGSEVYPPEVVAELVHGSAASRTACALALNELDVAALQHEFGIYGGEDGREVLDLLGALTIPAILVLHTVPRRPTPGQRSVLERLAELADVLVVQSSASRVRLAELYAIETSKVRVIPHGAHANLADTGRRRDEAHPAVVLTWGLLGRGKGIECGIEAIALLRDLEPAPRYVVLGQTHPRILERSGEEYRDSLVALAAHLGVADLVEFDKAYHDTAALLKRVRTADVVLLPYRSREQVVSGVIVEALASGKPVVATAFPHAEELLAEGSGILVPFEDAEATAAALRRLLTDPVLADRAAAVARRQARSFLWDNVAERYFALAEELTRSATRVRPLRFPPPPFQHLLRLSDDVGVFEHAKLTEPRREHGYCTDDVARALVAVMREPRRPPELERLASTCIEFLDRAQLLDGRFRNRLSTGGVWEDVRGSDDCWGRALWAAGTVAARASTREQRICSLSIFEAGAGVCTPSPRANGFAVLGAVELIQTRGSPTVSAAVRLLARATTGLGRVRNDPRWPWPEDRLAYANAVLAEARIAAGAALDDDRLLTEGLELLEWLVQTESRDDHFSFVPAGGWALGSARPGFDQQPIEAAAMADACARAFEVTGEKRWSTRALRAVAWFLGVNDVGVPLLDPISGGCRDGLTRNGVNENEGAESTIALITALQHARQLQAAARNAARSSVVSTEAAPMHRSAAP